MATAKAVPSKVFDIDHALAVRHKRRAELVRALETLLVEELRLAAETDHLLDLRRAETVHP